MHSQNPSQEVHLQDYINVIWRRRKTFLVVFSAIFLGVTLLSFIVKPVYKATATVHVLEDKGLLKGTMLSDLASVSPVDAEIEIVHSRTNAENVVKRLQLDWDVAKKSDNLDFRIMEFTSSAENPIYEIELTGADTYRVRDNDGAIVGTGKNSVLMRGKGITLLLSDLRGKAGDSFRLELLPFDETVEKLQKKLKVKELGKKTDIILIAYTNSDPARARDVVNTLVQTYLDQSIGFKSEEANRTVGFVEDQLKELRNDLDVNEKNLQAFKTVSGLIDLDAEAQALIQNLADTEKQKADISIQRKQAEFALASLNDSKRRGAIYSPVAMRDDPTMTGLAAKLADLEAQKRALLVENTMSHPSVKAVQGQIDELQQKIQATYETALHNLTKQEVSINQQLARYEGQMKKLPEVERGLARLTRLAKVNADIYTFMLQKHEEARIAKASTISNINIIDPAIVPYKPVIPKALFLLLGVFIGSVCGIGVAFLQEYLDDTIKDPDAAKRELGTPVLAVIPHIARREGEPGTGIRESLVTHLEPKSMVAEAYRSLRTALHFSAIDRKRQTILVTSTFPAEGKSTTAANLAVIVAQTGVRVLIVDCDLRRPVLHETYGHSKSPGLTDLLAGDSTLERALHDTGIANLDLISAGTTPPNPAELLGSGEMRQFIESMRERYDTIIIDAPPALTVTDAPVLTASVDLVLLVMAAGRVPVKAAQRMREMLDTVGARVAGIVMNDKAGLTPERYGYYGYYGYYGDENDSVKGKSWWRKFLKF